MIITAIIFIMSKITQKQINDKLSEVLDPELNISIVDLGLIYKVELTHPRGGENRLPGGVKITMTLTNVGCPLVGLIESEIKTNLAKLGFKEKNIVIKLVFDPPWSVKKMTKKGKAMLGI